MSSRVVLLTELDCDINQLPINHLAEENAVSDLLIHYDGNGASITKVFSAIGKESPITDIFARS